MPVKGPDVMGSGVCWEYADLSEGAADAMRAMAWRRVIFMVEMRSPQEVVIEANVVGARARCKLQVVKMGWMLCV